jgi:NAD(P)-dependent dehydrogenase (short-subunit alcohol dehydrogenase family)
VGQRYCTPAGTRVVLLLHDPCSRLGLPLAAQVCDVSSLQAIKGLAEELKQSGEPLHVLVNNAGVMVSPLPPKARGFTLQWGPPCCIHCPGGLAELDQQQRDPPA